MKTIVLDLEGTLISNAVSQFPRPHLKEFISFCLSSYDRVCLMTAVRTDVARKIIENLTIEGLLPIEFCATLEYVEWSGPWKDLRFIQNVELENTWIVDDNVAYIHPEQYQNWIEVKEYDPYNEDDKELLKVIENAKR